MIILLALARSHAHDVPKSTFSCVPVRRVQPQFLSDCLAERQEPPAHNWIVRKDFGIMQVSLSAQVH